MLSILLSQHPICLQEKEVKMNRRQFLLSNLISALSLQSPYLWAANKKTRLTGEFPSFNRSIIINLMLVGGPDWLHLMPPPFNEDPDSVEFKHWQERAGVHGLDDKPESWQQRWQQDYFPVKSGQTEFGILKKCAWLKDMFEQGHVSVYHNVIAGKTRDHAHCQLIMELGDEQATLQDVNKAGWGGRYAVETNTNVAALTPSPRKICHCPHPTDRNKYTQSNIIPAGDTRAMVLYEATSKQNQQSILARSLKNYYAAKSLQIPEDSIYRRIVEHEVKLRRLGQPITQRLAEFPVPVELQNLIKGEQALHDKRFATQIRNLYDALVCQDIFNMSMASMDYVAWDTHKQQKKHIEPKFNDLFGYGRGLDTLYKIIPKETGSQLTWLIGGEFARTFKANGAKGSDHSDSGHSMLVIHTGKKTSQPVSNKPITISQLIKTVTG